MTRYLLSRLLWAIPVLLAILIINFLLTHVVPGDPVEALVGEFPVPPGYVQQIRHDFGLDKPLIVQLWLYMLSLAHGNLGFSFANRQPVLGLVLDRARFTLMLMVPALLAASIAGVTLAVIAAPRAGGWYDAAITGASLFGYSVPVFWLAQVLIVLFAVNLGWLPAQGMFSVRGGGTGIAVFWDYLRHLILPGFSVSIFYLAVVARVARSSLIEALHQDFVLTANGKGLSRRRVMWRHVLPNASMPIVNVIGYNFGFALTGAILAETVFGWPGLGGLFIASIGNRDYPVLEGIFLLSAIGVVLVNLATDLVSAWIDPRINGSLT